ncbi:hypothetical protein [Nitrosomonas sp.]|uniref:hypothetical protein n=1 Tax=Nitrosomonas sp. TaxID=42353 RepID=UPI0025FC4318|nr:hypothetical protein [Nitrosomonas sp.]
MQTITWPMVTPSAENQEGTELSFLPSADPVPYIMPPASTDAIAAEQEAAASIQTTEPVGIESQSDTESQVSPEPRQPITLPDLAESGLVMIETAPDQIAEVSEESLAPVKRPRIRPSHSAELDTTDSEPLVQVETRD